MEVNIFKQNTNIPKKIGEVNTVKFKSFGLNFKVDLVRITNGKKGLGIVSARLFVNKNITNSMDFTDFFITERIGEFQRVIIYSVFNQRFSRIILNNIED